MPEYSKQQVMLAICYMSYFGFALTGSDRKNAQKILTQFNRAIATWKPIKDQWKVVWGPAVYALPGTQFDDSLMFVLQSTLDPGQYTIVIRGTNPISIPNWVIWDFQAKELKDWPYAEPDDLTPKISESTYFGLIVLQALLPGAGLPGEKQTLLEFLKRELRDRDSADICVTGHSLGGALATTVALWLDDIQADELPAELALSTVTIASPTPGNADFAGYFNRCLGDRCDRIVNSLDIVPYAWEYEQLKKLPSLYFPPLLPSAPLFLLLSKMLLDARGKDYKHVDPSPTILPGEYKFFTLPYIMQAIYQHVQGYPELMDMQEEIPIEQLLPIPRVLQQAVGPIIRRWS